MTTLFEAVVNKIIENNEKALHFDISNYSDTARKLALEFDKIHNSDEKKHLLTLFQALIGEEIPATGVTVDIPFLMVVPLKRLISHNYALNVPCLSFDLTDIAYRSNGTIGNHLPKRSITSWARLATKEEILTFMNTFPFNSSSLRMKFQHYYPEEFKDAIK